MLSSLDLRWAWRRLTAPSHRSYAIGSIFTLALTITALVLITQYAHAVLWAPLPFRDADALLRVAERQQARGLSDYAVSTPNFESWREGLADQAEFAATRYSDVTLNAEGDRPAERALAFRSTENLWQVLGLPLIEGRAFEARERQAGHEPVAIVSHSLWQRLGAGQVGAQQLRIDGLAHRVIGVAADDVGFSARISVWLPLQPDGTTVDRGDRRLNVWARLRPGVSRASFDAALAATSQRLAQEFAIDNAGWDAHSIDARSAIVGPDVSARLWLLLAAATLLLLLAATNVTNLQIARALEQARDGAVRHALGASTYQLLRASALESALLALIGAGLGVLIAALLMPLLSAFIPASLPRAADQRFSLGVALVASMLALLPVLAGGALAALLALRRVAVAGSGARSTGPGSTQVRRVLVVAQFALASVLLLGAASLSAELARLRAATLGYTPEALLMARVSLPEVVDEASHQRALAQYQNFLSEARVLPGVRAAAIGSEVPMGELDTGMEVVAGADPARLRDAVHASWRIVSDGYLQALGVPLLRGREFAASDESAREIILSAGLARTLWPDGSEALGRDVTLGNGMTFRVIGVAGDVRQLRLDAPPTPTMYLPVQWYLWPTMTLVVRGEGDAQGLLAPIRDLARRIWPEYPLFDLRQLSTLVQAQTDAPQRELTVIAAFAAASGLLAALGIASVIAFGIAQRRRELAVRLALGARAGTLWADLIGQGMRLCAAGIAIGLLVASALGEIAGSLFRVHTTLDGRTVLALLAIAALGLAASAAAARRVTTLAPQNALRSE